MKIYHLITLIFLAGVLTSCSDEKWCKEMSKNQNSTPEEIKEYSKRCMTSSGRAKYK